MKTEIFGTFGPACKDESIIKQMVKEGLTGMRLNLSHTTLMDSKEYIDMYQKITEELGLKAQLFIDMQGPELRIGTLKDLNFLEEETNIVLCSQERYEKEWNPYGEFQIPVPKRVLESAEAGDRILFDDGKILVEVYDISETEVYARVIRSGIVRSHKSVKIVDKNIQMTPLTAHDIVNIKCAKKYGVTALMQPFVLNGEELRYVRSVLREHGAEDIQIFAKIENRVGVENIENILPEADGIIIARGDLGNDMPLWELPRVQKQIEEACKKAEVPYVVVTQMLASMEENPVPTRAEVSDIFHAVFYGAYGIMVTGETAVGKYPVEAIRYLSNTAKSAEEYKKFYK